MGQMREQLDNFDEREIDRIQAVIQSMTPAERDNPKLIDGSRRTRIARGSGRQVSDVNQLVDRFFEARKMMQTMAAGRWHPGDARSRGHERRQAWQGQAAGQGQEAGIGQPGQGRRPAEGRVGLPAGSTPVDFAYAVHTEVGHHCIGGRVNGRLVPLESRARNGDVVEVLTSKADGGRARRATG